MRAAQALLTAVDNALEPIEITDENFQFQVSLNNNLPSYYFTGIQLIKMLWMVEYQMSIVISV